VQHDIAAANATFDTSHRIIEGYAAVFGNLDRAGEIIDRQAFDRTLKEQPDIAVFVGHKMNSLPVGEPIEVRPDEKGLYTRTRVYNTAEGDALLEVAKERLSAGRTLGMSIGYRTVKDDWEKRDGATVRKLLDVDLAEYSYLASPVFAANPEAQAFRVKDGDADCQQCKHRIGMASAGEEKAIGLPDGMSLDDFRQALIQAIRDAFPALVAEDGYCWIADIYDDRFVFEVEDRYYRVAYTVTDDGAVSVQGQPEEVVRRVSYEPTGDKAMPSARLRELQLALATAKEKVA